MRTGTEIRCITDQDMLEFVRWIRDRGGECICTDFEKRVLKIIRGTDDEKSNDKNNDKSNYNFDGILGVVDTDESTSEIRV